jgi:hypothetical protein
MMQEIFLENSCKDWLTHRLQSEKVISHTETKRQKKLKLKL